MLGAAVLCFGLVTVPCAAANYTWGNGGLDGNWDCDACWGGTEPTASDGARINNGADVTVNLTGEVASNLALGYAGADTGNLTITGGDLTMSTNGNIQVGRLGTGYILTWSTSLWVVLS